MTGPGEPAGVDLTAVAGGLGSLLNSVAAGEVEATTAEHAYLAGARDVLIRLAGLSQNERTETAR